MQIVHAQCAGLDVHKKTVVVCCRIAQLDGSVTTHIQTFSTMTVGLLALVDWLLSWGITHVAMESTGEFWKPVYNLLEASFTVVVVNAQHIKHVPGRTTDVKDAPWIAELLAHGLRRPSFVPPAPQRALRALTRQRTHRVQARTQVVNQLHKVLEWANLKLTSVVTDGTGVSARAMLTALLDGQTDVTVLAELAQGRLRAKRADWEHALRGTLHPRHAFMLTQHLTHIDFLEEQIATFATQIDTMIATNGQPPRDPPEATSSSSASVAAADGTAATPASQSWAAGRALCDAVPGIGLRLAETILAELGTDMRRFPSAAHAASWAGLAPGQHESAGKRRAVRTGKGNRSLKTGVVQAAWAAIKRKDSFLAAFYHRLAARCGAKKAIVAVAHTILVIGYTLLKTGNEYEERGAATLDDRQKERLVARMQRRIERLGYTVNVEPVAAAPVSP